MLVNISHQTSKLLLPVVAILLISFSNNSIAFQNSGRRSPLAALVKDSVCNGVCTQAGRNNYPMTLYVIDRKQDVIKVALSFPTVPCMEIAVGTINNEKLFLSTSQPVGAKAMLKCAYTGRLTGKSTLKGSWEGEGPKRKKFSGTFLLKLPASR